MQNRKLELNLWMSMNTPNANSHCEAKIKFCCGRLNFLILVRIVGTMAVDDFSPVEFAGRHSTSSYVITSVSRLDMTASPRTSDHRPVIWRQSCCQ